MTFIQPGHNVTRKQLTILKRIVLALTIILVGGVIYSNSLNVPFLFDDTERITENSFIRVTQLDAENMETFFQGLKASIFKRPVILTTFAINYYLGRYDVTGYHIFNIAVHILNGLLLFLFIRSTITIYNRLSQSSHKNMHADGIAFLSALLWLVHPLHTQSVTYIVQRMNSLAAMFYLISMLFYIQARRRQPPLFSKANPPKISIVTINLWFFGSIIAGILAVSSKQNAAALPVFIILYEWFFFQDLSIKWLRQKALPIMAMMILMTASALFIMGIDPLDKLMSFYAPMNFTLPQRVLSELRVVVYYISLMVYPNPNRLNLEYDFPLSFNPVDPFTTLTALAAILGLFFWAGMAARKKRLLSFCMIWFLGNLVIESSVIGLDLIYEHRTYLPSMQISLLIVGFLFQYLPRKTWLPAAVICAAILICSIWTYQRNIVWADELTFWQDCVTKSPTRSRPLCNAGVFLNARGHMEEAIQHFDKALAIAPENYSAYLNKGVSLFKLERFDAAIYNYNQALQINSGLETAHNNLGNAFARQGRDDDAIYHYQQAIRINPAYDDAHYNLANLYDSAKQFQAAVNHYSEAVRINPDNEMAHNNLGNTLNKMGSPEKAIPHYLMALQIRPDLEMALNNLGNTLFKTGRTDEAITYYLKSIAINPNNERIHYNLSVALFQKHKIEQSIAHLQTALRLNPDYREAKNFLNRLRNITQIK